MFDTTLAIQSARNTDWRSGPQADVAGTEVLSAVRVLIFLACFAMSLLVERKESGFGVVLKSNVDPSPRLIVEQSPFVT